MSHDTIIILEQKNTPPPISVSHTLKHIQPLHRESRGEPQKEYGMFCHLVGRLSLKSHIQLSLPALSRLLDTMGENTTYRQACIPVVSPAHVSRTRSQNEFVERKMKTFTSYFFPEKAVVVAVCRVLPVKENCRERQPPPTPPFSWVSLLYPSLYSLHVH